MPRQHPQCRDQDPLRLLDANRLSTPALPHRPFADAPLQADDVPDAAAGRAAETAQRIEGLADAAAGVHLGVGEIAWPAAARQSHQRHAADDIEPGDGELGLEVARGVVHALGDRAGAQHDAERVHGAVVDDRPAVGIGLVDRLEGAVRPLDGGNTASHDRRRASLAPGHHPKGTSHPGEHQAIIEAKLWAKAHPVVRDSPRARAAATRARTPALLKGLLFSADGRAMTPTHTRKKGRLYRYYIASKLLDGDGAASLVNRVPAAAVEVALVERLRRLLRAPEIVARTWAAVNAEADLAECDVCQALAAFEPLWDELFPAEQARIVRLLVERVTLASAGMRVRLRVHGLQTLIEELHGKATAA